MHCHLDLYPNPYQIAKECNDRRMYVLSVTTTPKAWHGTQGLTKEYKRIRTSLGLHPQLAHERFQEIELFDQIIPEAQYVGEIGLDGTKNYRMHFERQMSVFKHILKSVERSGGSIMSVHSAGAVSSVLTELAKHKDAGIPILHWFTGSKSELRKAIEHGCWFSIGPAMLATKRGQELIKEMPHNRILPETDGPFTKLGQEMMMPWNVVTIHGQLAKAWNSSPNEIADILAANFATLIDSNKRLRV